MEMTNYEDYECYAGDDLGSVYEKHATSFRLWAPTAKLVKILFYEDGYQSPLKNEVLMAKSEGGTWFAKLEGDLAGLYYTYQVQFDGYTEETADPYAKAVGVNGNRSMVIDLKATNPEGFDLDQGPKITSYTDAIIYELSVADTTAASNTGVKNKRTYMGLTELNTCTPSGVKTGLSHVKDLGVTHVQLMPSYDFGSIDEAKDLANQYNWGYDPVNYYSPEGSYATDAFSGQVRVEEFKKMVQAFHKEGIGVIMDVVFNHTYDIEHSVFQKTVPDYYYRKDGEKYSDASACGNEVASDRTMVRKYIIDCVCYWTREYHIDGFRFDLMGVLDIETMNQLVEALKEINPYIMIYGEGWTGGSSTLEEKKRAMKVNCKDMPSVSMFSDDMRDAVRGDVFISKEKGFATGKAGLENDLKYSIVGAISHPQVDYSAYTYTDGGSWAAKPGDTLNYISCHDNLTLWDKIYVTNPEESVEKRKKRNKLGAAIVLTSQGVPFMLSGEEFLRTKKDAKTGEVCENSYNTPIEMNQLDYDLAEKNQEIYAYYKGLIKLRKAYHEFRMNDSDMVCKKLVFSTDMPSNVVAYKLLSDEETLFVAFNGNDQKAEITLPNGMEWDVLVDANQAGDKSLYKTQGSIKMEECSAFIAVSKK